VVDIRVPHEASTDTITMSTEEVVPQFLDAAKEDA
tara:strand:- start:583 stop:687 length:105 start_codon:yes stop_codon:yes gene_type:complete